MQKIIYSLLISLCSMLHAGKEIELKISVPDDVSKKIEQWLDHSPNRSEYMAHSEQTEYYLRRPDDAWDNSNGFKDTLETLRIRSDTEQGDSVCYKYRHLDPITKKTTHRDEEETKIDSAKTMHAILAKIGYAEQTVIKKNRITYNVRTPVEIREEGRITQTADTFEVVFDDVTNIGKFIEIELKSEVADVKVGLGKIEALLKEIGVTEFTQYDRGYIHMAWNPDYNFGEKRNLK